MNALLMAEVDQEVEAAVGSDLFDQALEEILDERAEVAPQEEPGPEYAV